MIAIYSCLALAAICLVGIGVFFKRKRDEYWMSIEKIEDMQKLHWREFEEFIMFVLQKKGFKAKLGKGIKDGGVDIEASFEGRKYLIQCKKWNRYKVSEPNIREFLGSISDFNADKGIYVTTSRLTSDAKLFAKRNDIEIWDKDSLEMYVREFTGKNIEKISTGTAQKETKKPDLLCDKCGAKMLIRVAKNGVNKGNEFYGCEDFPKCKNIINM